MGQNHRRKKIILFIDSLGSGGAQRQLVELAANLDRERFDVKVLIYHDIQHLREPLDRTGIPVVLIQKTGKFDLGYLRQLSCYLQAEKPDILHSFLNTPNFFARIAGKMAGIKTIITSERNVDIQHSFLKMMIERILHPASDLIIVNAEAIKRIFVDKLKVSVPKIKTIYNGVNIETFKIPSNEVILEFKKLYQLHDSQFTIVLPGRLQRQKNHACLVKAIIEAKEHAGRWKVVFVGNEINIKLKQELQKQIEAYGMQDRFVFAGRQEDMGLIYAIADVVVLPSLWEGFPNVLLEAMSQETVVVASDIADNARIVSNGVNGFLFRSDDHEELAFHLIRLCAMSGAERAAMGRHGKRTISQDYSINKMVGLYEEVYSQFR